MPLAQWPTDARGNLDSEPCPSPVTDVGEGRRQTDRSCGHAGSRLNRNLESGRRRLKRWP